MKIFHQAWLVVIAFAMMMLTACSRDVIKPLQVNPISSPHVVIFHEAKYRAAPVVYVITLEDAASTKWMGLAAGEREILQAGEDFSVTQASLINGGVYIDPQVDLTVEGTLEVALKDVIIDLDIRPSAGKTTHPIDGRYRLTKPNSVAVHPAEADE